MFKLDLLNYKINSYILLFLSLFTILFNVSNFNQLLLVLILLFSIFHNLRQYRFKTILSSIISIIAIFFQFKFSDYTFSKEFFLNVILILVFIKFSEIKKKQDHYFFNFTVIFLTISSLIYGQDFLSSINSFLLMLVSIIHLYSLNQKKILKINTKYIFKYLSISLLILPIMALVYFIFPRYEVNIKIFDTTKNTLGIPETLKLGSFTDITYNNQAVFIYSDDLTKNIINPLYFRVKIFDLINKDRFWITTPRDAFERQYAKTHELKKNNNILLNKNRNLIVYPNDKTWLPVLKGFNYDNALANNNYLNETAESRKKIYKKKKYLLQSNKFYADYNKEFLKFYQKLPSSTFSKKLITWSEALRKSSKSDMDYLNNLLKHFANGEYYYTLTPTVDKTNDYEKFFFETKSGYCEYYAGMFTILARLQNIPTRIVTGYLGGEYNDIGNFYTFRQSDAHSWVEVYINDKGWIKFDPTLAIPKENILSFNNYSLKDFQSNSIDDDEATSKLSMIKLYYSYFDYTWTNKFLNYNKESRDKFLKNKIKNFEIKKEFYIFIVVFFLMLLFYKITKSLMQKKLFFTLFFNKIKSQKGINSNVLTHQEIKVILSVREKIKLNEIFTIYEKIIFAKKCNLTIKNYFYFNYKIIRFCYFNK
jgi:hypothetical protein